MARRRWGVLVLLLAVTVINFVDRQVLSVVAPVLRDELGLSNKQYGFIVSSFMFGMLLGELPMGVLMDRVGPRIGLAFAVVYWSVANALHAGARGVASLSLLRVWLGTGECGNYSGGVKVVSQWFPPKERAFAIGVFNSGSMLGAMIATPLIGFATLAFGWRAVFLLSGALGLVWSVVWWGVYRPPTADEARAIGQSHSREAPALSSVLRRRDTWALMACRFLVGPVVQFYIYWLPEYLFRARGFSLKAIASFGWLPFLFGDAGSLLGGLVAGAIIARGVPVARARAATLLGGALLCALSMAVAVTPSTTIALAAVCAVLFGHTVLSANMFASIADRFPPEAAGRVTALTGIAGGLSGVIFPLVSGALIDRVSWKPVFFVASLMPLFGVAALLILGKARRRPA